MGFYNLKREMLPFPIKIIVVSGGGKFGILNEKSLIESL